ncbi:hypothetical protein [Leptospira interrogans]|uniref:hypothetical protein n=1 Tax=Leptospira interrogans TaxID=173 RepID=UPI0007731B5B|nr:hypothetical protein [Leptospira interrogans]
MKLVVDSCCLISWNRSAFFEKVIDSGLFQLQIGYFVLDELRKETWLISLINNGQINVIDLSISLEEVETFSKVKKLGSGESEAILIAKTALINFCSDDNRARKIATAIVGKNKVIGTLGIMKSLNEQGFINKTDLYLYYQNMKTTGSFLPDYSEINFNAFLLSNSL